MATTQFRLSTKADKITGQHEVLVRFFHGRIGQYGKTNIFVQPQHWNQDRQRVTIPRVRVMSDEAKKLTTELADINTRLERMEQFIQDSFMDAGAGKVELPGTWLADILHEYNFPTPKESRAVVDVMERFIDTQYNSESNKAHGRAVLRALKRFLIFSGSPAMDLDQVTPDTLHDFVEYLRMEHTFYEAVTDKDGKRKMVFLNDRFKEAFQAVPESRWPMERGQNAINKFLGHLRSVFIWAVNNDMTTNNPFRKYTIPADIYGTPYYITIDERNQLMNYDLSDNPRLAVQRDIFVFQCVIGCRVSDLRNLTKDSIIDGAVEYIPRKTKEGRPVAVRVPLNSVARAILERYKDTPGTSCCRVPLTNITIMPSKRCLRFAD